MNGSKLERIARNTPAMATTAKAQRHGQRKDLAVVEPHQLRDLGVVRGGAEGAAQGGAVEQELQPGDHGDRGQRT